MTNKTRTFAELFAGCGGMSLGIESEGFRRIFSNELSPMPAATYAYNLVHKKRPLTENSENWYTRLYELNNEESPKANPALYANKEISPSAIKKLKKFDGEMFVGGVHQLNQALKQIPIHDRKNLKLDILSGGPPCQSFSLAGKRDKNNPRNDLPFEFAESASLLQPKVVLLENVSGILSPFTDTEGNKWHAWFEVAKAFHAKGYIPICTHAEAQKYGVPQRRPRFLMVAIRSDIAEKSIKRLNALPNGERLDWQSTRLVIEESINYFDTHKGVDLLTPNGFRWIEPNDDWPELLLPLNARPIDVESVIDNLTNPKSKKDRAYLKDLFEAFEKVLPPSESSQLTADELDNIAHRKHSLKVKARFRLLRLLAIHSKTPVDNKNLQNMSEQDINWLLKQPLIFPSDETDKSRIASNKEELISLVKSLESKKHSQRALLKNKIAPAQLSIPDDLVHYQEDRTLSVREMARIQSFPDNFEFKGKVTTGGNQRTFEVPRYTQVGNAVPPLMAKQIAKGINNFLNIINE